MAFQTPITVKKVIDQIHRREFVLPAIQREFVWSPAQICQLFDSLLRGYPIGSFLFWRVDRDRCRDYTFYGFLDDYHERDNRHNPSSDQTGEQGVIAILDGQQRLTSLNIGLRGSFSYKTKHKRKNSPDAYPKRRLHLNLLKPVEGEDVDLHYDFRFLTDEEAAERSDDVHWFRVGELLQIGSRREINSYLRKNDLIQSDYADECMWALYDAIAEDKLINYYEEEDQDLDKVLNIFIRVNSGGTELSYSDLLLSIATAQWESIDAREAIYELVDDLNATGDGFSFTKDFVLKASLVLADLKEIGFKVKSFTRENTAKIESAWDVISTSLRGAVELAASFGYSGRTLTANNVLIPVAYYLRHIGNPAGYATKQEFADDREQVRSWMTRALLKSGTFGSGLDTTLRAAKNAIDEAGQTFPTEGLDLAFAKIGKGLRFGPEEISELLERSYGSRGGFGVLSLLYPNVDFRNRFHEDHIFPKSRFTRKRLRDAGVDEDKVETFMGLVNCIPNLQLLESTPNQEKSAKMPGDWVKAAYPTDAARAQWEERNYIPSLPDDLNSFDAFFNARRDLLMARLTEVLAPHAATSSGGNG